MEKEIYKDLREHIEKLQGQQEKITNEQMEHKEEQRNLNLRIDKYYKDTFEQNQKFMEQLNEITKKLNPISDLYTDSLKISRGTIRVTKFIVALIGIATTIFGALYTYLKWKLLRQI